MNYNSIQFVFFGTDKFSIIVLDERKKAGFIPSLVVTAQDKKQGRGMKLTPPSTKIWAEKNSVQFLQPEKLDGNFYDELAASGYEPFIVASYGKIIPKKILEIPKHGALNVHPSLLPLYRGPSPIQSQILDNADGVGVTIMLMDEEMDHGPIVAQKQLKFSIFNFQFSKLHDELAYMGGQLLAEVIPNWIEGKITPQEQNHSEATYTKKITKKDGLIDLNDDPKLNYRKYLACSEWPKVYFFKNNKRIKIKLAEFANGEFKIKRVIPEGKKEMDYKDFLRGRESKKHIL